jgi:hypothetical protein
MRLKNILTLVITFILSIGLVFGSYAIFNPIKVERERQETLSIAKEYFSNAQDFNAYNGASVGNVKVSLALKVLGQGGSELGYLYEANVTNSYGNIRVRVVAGVDQKISEIDLLELNQTMYQAQTTNKINTYLFTRIDEIADSYAGATSVSIRSLVDMMVVVRDVHKLVPKTEIHDPYEEYFGEYSIDSTDTQTVNDATVVIQTITGSKKSGAIYTVTKMGTGYVDHSDDTITAIIILDSEGNILLVDLPTDLYNHTKGSYYNQVRAYARGFMGQNIADITDAYSGGTNEGLSDTPHNSMSLVHHEMVIVKELWLA